MSRHTHTEENNNNLPGVSKQNTNDSSLEKVFSVGHLFLLLALALLLWLLFLIHQTIDEIKTTTQYNNAISKSNNNSTTATTTKNPPLPSSVFAENSVIMHVPFDSGGDNRIPFIFLYSFSSLLFPFSFWFHL